MILSSQIAGASTALTSREKILKVRPEETVTSILTHFGFHDTDHLITHATMSREFRLTPGERYFVEKNSQGLALRFFDPRQDRSYLFWRRGRTQSGSEMQHIDFITRERTVGGRIEGSIINSILAQIPNNWVASRFMDAYLFDFNVSKDVQRGARYSLTVEEKYWHGQFVRYGEVMKTSLEINGRIYTRHFVKVGQGGSFIDDHLRLRHRPLYAPIGYLRFASLFNLHRYHPIRHRYLPHLGLDFEAPYGAPIYAALSGYVKRIAHTRAAGYVVTLSHGHSLETSYCHLARLPRQLFIGEHVHAGEKIGEVGCTGYCTQPHLHFAVRFRGRMIDPMHVIKSYPYQYEKSILSKALRFQHAYAKE